MDITANSNCLMFITFSSSYVTNYNRWLEKKKFESKSLIWLVSCHYCEKLFFKAYKMKKHHSLLIISFLLIDRVHKNNN